MSQSASFYSKDNNRWDLSTGRGVGGPWFFCSNLSLGYHGLLRQYWDKYKPHSDRNMVLLVGDNNTSKTEFNTTYPNWEITTTDLYPELKAGINCDILFDTCSSTNILEKKYDIIINQANLEHMYNPFQAMKNLSEALNTNGILLTHTHPPKCPYHAYPRDYFRFMNDWWYDLPTHIKSIELIEFYAWNEEHVFSMYRKM
jgi:hypothetical protein